MLRPLRAALRAVYLASLGSYSAIVERLAPDTITRFIHEQLDLVSLSHSTFTDASLGLIARSSEGPPLRAVKNLCVGGMIEGVRDQTKTIDTKQVNAVLLQPHWRHNQQQEPRRPSFWPIKNRHKDKHFW